MCLHTTQRNDFFKPQHTKSHKMRAQTCDAEQQIVGGRFDAQPFRVEDFVDTLQQNTFIRNHNHTRLSHNAHEF
jgi:hypothetical protein